MSKTGLAARLTNLRDKLEAVDPRALAIHRMPFDLRLKYDKWRGQCIRHDVYLERAGLNAYEQLISETDDSPSMPEAVRQYLGIEAEVELTVDMTLEQVADLYHEMTEGTAK